MYGFDFSCIKALAMTEPLVDCVDPNQIATNTQQVRAWERQGTCVNVRTVSIKRISDDLRGQGWKV